MDKIKGILSGIGSIVLIFGLLVGLPLFLGSLGNSTDNSNKQPATSNVAPTAKPTVAPLDNAPIERTTGSYVDNNGTSDCTDDCSGHEAGYEWARNKDVCDPEFDGGNSESFAEGVRAYAYDNCYYEENGEPF